MPAGPMVLRPFLSPKAAVPDSTSNNSHLNADPKLPNRLMPESLAVFRPASLPHCSMPTVATMQASTQ